VSGRASQRVWAIVLTAGGEEITAACLESLLAQDYPALTVLLVDNASPDGSGERLRRRFGGIEYLNTGGNLGYTGGNNAGIARALAGGADYLLVLNNDTVVEPHCVSLLVRSAEGAQRVGLVAPKILYFDDPTRVWFGGGDFARYKAIGVHREELRPDRPNEPADLQPITFATGCCVLLPAHVAREMNGFAEDFFMYCEDVELSLRLSAAGYRLYYQPAARLLHRQAPRAPDPTPFQLRMRDRNRRRIVRRHYRLMDRAKFAMWFYPTRAVRFCQYLLRGDWARARAIVAGATEA
jgi:GT2 family glycosyltransferase